MLGSGERPALGPVLRIREVVHRMDRSFEGQGAKDKSEAERGRFSPPPRDPTKAEDGEDEDRDSERRRLTRRDRLGSWKRIRGSKEFRECLAGWSDGRGDSRVSPGEIGPGKESRQDNEERHPPGAAIDTPRPENSFLCSELSSHLPLTLRRHYAYQPTPPVSTCI